jgi:hypothetical protein
MQKNNLYNDIDDDPILRSLRSSHPVNPIDQHISNDHHKDFKSGIRVGSIGTIDLDEIEKKEKASKRQSIIIVSILAGVFLIFGIIAYLTPDERKPSSQTTKPGAPAKGTAAPKPQADGRQGTAHTQSTSNTHTPPSTPSTPPERTPVSNTQRQQANTFLDSAKSTQNDMGKTIAFYKMAISFNKYNLQAWQGLLQAYRESNKSQEAAETEEQMIAIFGNEVNSVSALVKQFGELTDTYRSESGAYRVEYKTTKRSKNEILREIYTMARSVRSACNCQAISIYAITGAGKGMIAHTTPETSIHSLSAFERGAEILWLQ